MKNINATAAASFTDLGIYKCVERALKEGGITQPTEIQKKSIPLLIEGKRDFVGLAQTGTGKTAAFGLPLLQHINAQRQGIQALILSPTRELGQQIAKQLVLFSKYLPDVRIKAVYGGTPLGPQIKSLRKPPQIIVATPGRLIDLSERHAINMTHITHLILDEADEMLHMGFQPAVDHIFSLLPSRKRTWMFSATMPRAIHRLVHQYMAKDHVSVKVNANNVVNSNIEHQYIVCQKGNKQHVLQTLLDADQSKQSIIFCRTKATTQNIAQGLSRNGVRVDSLHGDLTQTKRDKAIGSLKHGRLQALVATDIAARGIDVKDLHYVIHYNVPENPAYYTHRSGRTARAGRQGTSICLVNQQEVKMIRNIADKLAIQFKKVAGPDKTSVHKLRLEKWAKSVLEAPDAHADPVLVQQTEEAFSVLSKQELITRLVAIL